MGYLTIPKALDDLLGPTSTLPVSVVWDTVTKKPLRVGLVLNPEITDAQVTAAFSASGPSIDTAAIYARRNGQDVATFSRGGLDTAAIYRRMSGRA